MARLAFFTESLPSSDRSRPGAPSSSEVTDFSYDLMTNLADQQHDVRVFSTYRESDTLPPSHPRLQIMRPFKRWGWLEIPRLVPILLDFQPEILHFIQPRREAFSGLTNAMTAVPSLAPLIGKPKVVVSLYDTRRDELNKNRGLLAAADSIIVANRQQADEVEKWIESSPKVSAHPPTVSIVALPTVDTGDRLNEREVMPGLDQITSRSSKPILIPGDLDAFGRGDLDSLAILLNELFTAVPGLRVIFGGGWGRLSAHKRRSFMRLFEDHGHGAKILLTGPLSPAGEQSCLEVAKLVLLAGLPESSLSLARWIRLGLQASRPMVLSEEQCRLDPLKFRHMESAFIVTDDLRQWATTLSVALTNDSLRNEVRARLPDFARTEAVDQPGNAMSRIYAQVLRSNRTSR